MTRTSDLTVLVARDIFNGTAHCDGQWVHLGGAPLLTAAFQHQGIRASLVYTWTKLQQMRTI